MKAVENRAELIIQQRKGQFGVLSYPCSVCTVVGTRLTSTEIRSDDQHVSCWQELRKCMDTRVLPLQLSAAEAMSHLDHMCALDINSRASYGPPPGIQLCWKK
ncbi:unnamed protein product [Callosobruchus maculatus]|uniref:Uncharacterized protein n=1 Tax=Callosobruchus maculatus TaxID=64391 RepID=A0A653BXE4_CALMS|nr:unnamed protein product [Callosobruchus maculatus]